MVAYLEDHVIPLLIGRDARRIEDTWQFLYRGAYWRRGPVTMRAIAAVDMALWDIKAKAAGLPLYDLLGGKSRDGVLVYGHANGADIEETCDEVERYRGAGLQGGARAERRPGARQALRRLARQACSTSRPMRRCRPRQSGRRRSTSSTAPKLFEQLRARFGVRASSCCTTCHHRLTPIEAARLGKALEPYRLFWLEDLTPAENQEAFRLIRQHTTTPLAVGEVFNTIWDAKDLIAEQLIDYIRATVVGRRRDHPPAPDRRLRRRSGRCAPAATARPTFRR